MDLHVHNNNIHVLLIRNAVNESVCKTNKNTEYDITDNEPYCLKGKGFHSGVDAGHTLVYGPSIRCYVYSISERQSNIGLYVL